MGTQCFDYKPDVIVKFYAKEFHAGVNFISIDPCSRPRAGQCAGGSATNVAGARRGSGPKG